MAAIHANGVLKTRTAPIFQCWRGARQGLWEHKGSRCTPTNAAHSPPAVASTGSSSTQRQTAKLTLSQLINRLLPLTHAGAASSQQSPQSSVSGREPTAHCASCDPPCASNLAASSPNPQTPRNPPNLRHPIPTPSPNPLHTPQPHQPPLTTD